MKQRKQTNRVIVGRYINGIFLNPLEYLLDSAGEIMTFHNTDHAHNFLKKNGFSDEEIYYLVFQTI